MNFEERKRRAIQIMKDKGLKKSSYAPPVHRLLWRAGVKIIPPLFAPLWLNAMLLGIVFAVPWGITMWLVTWHPKGASIAVVAISTISAGILYGLIMALQIKRTKRKHQLPDWNALDK